jgi:response regulator RpfG family c-di-GMP phosphodiesterase
MILAMPTPGRLTVLVVADRDENRTRHLDTLTDAGYAVRSTEVTDKVAAISAVIKVDVVVLDIGLQAAAFAVAESLAALPNRPRLVAVTDRIPTGTAIERLFDAYVLEPWSPENLVDAIHAAVRAPIPLDDLLIIARDHVGTAGIVQRYSDIGARIEVRVDRRGNEPPEGAAGQERRQRDRRARDVSERLRAAGWVFIPGVQRE